MTAGAADPRLTPVEGRLDWLALLPFEGVAQAVALLGDASLDEMTGVARHFGVSAVDRYLSNREIDVVIVRDTRAIADALAALAPAGVAWIEEPQRWRRSGRSVARAAKAGRLRVLARYWVLPTARRARRYIPIDHQAAVRWYLNDLFVPQNLVERVIRRVVVWFPRLAPLAGGTRATVVVGSESHADLLAGGPGTGVSRQHPVVVQTGGHDLGNRTIVVPFERSGGRVGSLLKVASTPEVNDLVDAEFRSLQDLHITLPKTLTVGIPVPEARWNWAGRTVTKESMFEGPTIDQAVNAGKLEPVAALEMVAEWLARFHRATARSEPWSVGRFTEQVLPALDAYQEVYGADSAVVELFARVESRSRQLVGFPLVGVRRHWDLTPSNVIFTTGGVAVIDWEPGVGRPLDARGLPVADLDYFVKFWLHLAAPRALPQEQSGMFPHTASTLSRNAHVVLTQYCEKLGVDPAFVPMISVYQWAEQAVHDHHRGRRVGNLPEARRAADRHVRALANDQSRLFAAW